MKKQSIIVVTILVCISFIISANLVIEPINNNDVSKERAVFIKSWAATYKDCSLDQLGISELPLFLDEAFDIEEQKLNEKQQDPENAFICFRALQDDKVVGYVSYDVVNDIAYIRQWGLLPEFCDLDTFRELILCILDYKESLHTVYTDIRIVADKYKQMLEELGFETSEVYSNFDNKLYVGFKFELGDKCGTCFSDYTEEDFDAEPVFDLQFSQDCERSQMHDLKDCVYSGLGQENPLTVYFDQQELCPGAFKD